MGKRRGKAWRKRNDDYVDGCSFANLTNYLSVDLPGRDAQVDEADGEPSGWQGG